ncbi:MAG: type II toxin-antitoxin system VapC family toxin [Candidatus Jettenia caeni]|nr:type II toxin-antitoxin system VapC family toxin [Candidatus Jettenia caeni]UJS18844.1 MAG: type II toxin-antitoxin system VapC family toxin [Candidatus Jettenia sp.]
MNLFIDTSALVKLYHHEAGTENLTNQLNQHAHDLIITIADLSKIEFYSTFLKRVRTKEITLEMVKKVFEAFDKDLQIFNVVEVDTMIKSFAIQLLDSRAYQINLRTLDAI